MPSQLYTGQGCDYLQFCWREIYSLKNNTFIDGMWGNRIYRDIHDFQPVVTIWKELLIIISDKNMYYANIDLDPNTEHEWNSTELPLVKGFNSWTKRYLD